VERLGGTKCLDCAAAISNDWAKSVSFLLSLAPPALGETDGLWRISTGNDDPEF